MTALAEVQWGRTRIAYTLSRSARQKTLSIRVEPDGSVEVVAPASVTPDRVASLVHKKAAWIVERQRRVADLPPQPPPREFVSGETFLYLGRQHRLRVRTGAEPVVKLAAGYLEVSVPRGTTPADCPAVVRALLIDWYRTHATERLPERVADWAPKLGAHPKAVLVREPQKRWGSCDAAGNIRLNWRIIQAPRKLVDYVVAHELAHLVQSDHGRAFWSLLGRVMPDYEERRETLRRAGGAMVW
jgi:predicted metal-dependent hydrolase